jgi:hypothetical protein
MYQFKAYYPQPQMRSHPEPLEQKRGCVIIGSVKSCSKEKQITKNGEDRRKPVPAVFFLAVALD